MITDLSSIPSLLSNILGCVGSHVDPSKSVVGILYVGGNSNTNASNSVNYGVSYANANNNLNNSNDNIGSRLFFASSLVIPTSRVCGITAIMISGSVAFQANSRYIDKGSDIIRHRLSNVYQEICSLEVLKQASKDACEPRKDTLEVARYLPEENRLLAELQSDLLNHTYQPGDYNIYYKKERGKKRLIADQPLYPHRIVLCAIAIVIEDRLNRTLVWQTHAAIKGHGTHTVMMDMRRQIHNDPRFKYCLTMDIDQCYASIPPGRIKAMFREYIKDRELLDLLDRIIDAYNATGHPGIALGGRLSPLMANLYLSPLDHRIKEQLHCHAYARYMDNYFILGYSRQWLLKIQRNVSADLAELGLSLNSNWMVQPISETQGVDMVGWIVYSNHVLIRRKTKIRMKRTFRRIDAKLDRLQEPDDHDKGSIASYVGCLKWFDSWNLC